MTDTMRQLVILSGKGGTGKTTIAAALAHLASQEISLSLADADVDAANLELLLAAERLASHDFMGGDIAEINADLCIGCGACFDACRFDAISFVEDEGVYAVDDTACEGCAACFYRCPVSAITMTTELGGYWYESETPYGPLYHAHLLAGAENSGKLVTMVKQQARLRALDDSRRLVLVDGPPGIGCPVISALSGADVALMVVEPTLSGVHDLSRVVDVADHFDVPSFVALNKVDLSPRRAEEIEAYCEDQGVPIVARIPYDTVMTESMVQGVPVTAYTDGPVLQALAQGWSIIRDKLGLV